MSNDQVLISVIVPVHNAEQYLLPCFRSLSAQSHSNLEVFLVDDGSTDSSGKICDEYAETDGRFHVVHTPCNGPGSARNTGLDLARGEWIAFVDSDDVLHPDYFKYLLDAAVSTGTELAACEYQDQFGMDYPQFQQVTVNLRVISSETAIYSLLSGMISFMVVWAKLFSRRLLESIRFKTSMVEDTDFMARIFPGVSQIAYLENELYYYYRREGTLSISVNYQYYKVFAYWEILQYYKGQFPKYTEMAARLCLNSVSNFNKYRDQVSEPIRQQVDRIWNAAWKIAFPGKGLTKEKARMWLKLHFPKVYQKLVNFLSVLPDRTRMKLITTVSRRVARNVQKGLSVNKD